MGSIRLCKIKNKYEKQVKLLVTAKVCNIETKAERDFLIRLLKGAILGIIRYAGGREIRPFRVTEVKLT